LCKLPDRAFKISIVDNNKKFDEINAINLLNGGSKAAFNLLFEHYVQKLFCYSLTLTHSKEDAEEIVQETFLKVWENRQKIRSDLSFNAYIITIAKNLIFNKTKRKVLERSLFDYYRYTHKYIDTDTEDHIESEDFEAVKIALINKLPERRKQIILLRKNGYSNEEVALILRISKSTVANQVNTALKDLQKLFEKFSVIAFLILYS
jgi:RNA polymerase sigma-70 factor, ECF subfamily